MLSIPVALVSSLGEAGLRTINPNACEEETGDFGALALLGHEVEVHYHSVEQASETANPKDVVSELKERYGEGKVTNAFQRRFLRAHMVCCKFTLMTTYFATIVKSTSLIRY